jgi:hypothetical protein
VNRLLKTLDRGEASYPVFDGWSSCAAHVADLAIPLFVISAAEMAVRKTHGNGDVLWGIPVLISIDAGGGLLTVYPTPSDDIDLVEA